MKMKLDARTIRALALAKGRDEDFAWDAELEGFGLRLRRRNDGSLVRTWVAQYRFHGRTQRISFARFEKLTPIEARKAARKIFGRVANDGNPQAERQAKRLESPAQPGIGSVAQGIGMGAAEPEDSPFIGEQQGKQEEQARPGVARRKQIHALPAGLEEHAGPSQWSGDSGQGSGVRFPVTLDFWLLAYLS